MAYKKFTGPGGSFRPRASIRTVGQIGINKAAVKKYALGNHKHVYLYFDDETNKIGIEFCDDENAKDAVQFQVRDGGGTIAAKSFFNCFGINYSERVINDLAVETVEGKKLFTFCATKIKAKESIKPR